MSYATYRVIRNENLIEKDIWRFLLIVFDLERTNQLNLLHENVENLDQSLPPANDLNLNNDNVFTEPDLPQIPPQPNLAEIDVRNSKVYYKTDSNNLCKAIHKYAATCNVLFHYGI